MARPKITKTVCELPKNSNFYSKNFQSNNNLNFLTIEEYETIRLIDQNNLSQIECAEQMGVSRPTVQLMYAEARKKIADFIVNGGRLKIDGGDYCLCDQRNFACGNGNCRRRGRGRGRF